MSGDKIISSAGSALWTSPPVHFNAGHLFHVGATSGDYWLILGRTAIYALSGEVWTNVSSSAGYEGLGENDELNWTAADLGSVPLVNNPQHYPEMWLPTNITQELLPLPWKIGTGTAQLPEMTFLDAGVFGQVIRTHKNFVFLLNITEQGVAKPNAYRWSHPASINGIPFTWDDQDKSSLAGTAQIGGDGGVIIDGMSMRDSFVIYSETSVSILDPTLDEFVWKRRELSTSVGLIAKNALVQVKGRHYFLGDGDILVNDGNTIKSLVHNKLRRSLVSNINADYYYRSYVLVNSAVKEIWFCVPTKNSEYPDTAYIYNWVDNTWAIRRLPYKKEGDIITTGINFAGYGPQGSGLNDWANWQGSWDNQLRVWGSRERTPLDDTLVGISVVDSSLHILDPTDIAFGDLNTSIERTNFPLNGHVGVNTVTRIYPHIQGTADVSIQVGSQDKANGAITWANPQTFRPGSDRKIDLRSTGKLFCWRVQSIGTGNFQLSGMTFEYTSNGVR